MKYILLFLLTTIIVGKAYSQTSQAEAKAAYLLAEESYGKGDMQSSLKYIDLAANKLGVANAKMLYLKIMALQVLAADDDASLADLKKAISVFEKAPDYQSFNEEKQLEVMKLKITLEKEAASGSTVDPLLASACAKIGLTSWQIGATLEDMKAANPDFFAKAKKFSQADSSVYYQLNELSITVSKGRVIVIMKNMFSSIKDDASFTNGRSKLADFKNYLGGSPSETAPTNTESPPSKWATMSTASAGYSWAIKRAMVLASLVTIKMTKYRQPDTYESSFTVLISYQPK